MPDGKGRKNGGVVTVHTAGSATEAIVVRGLLESAGIMVAGSVAADPFPMREPPEGFGGAEILVPESQAHEARRIIAEYLTSNASAAPDDSEENPAS